MNFLDALKTGKRIRRRGWVEDPDLWSEDFWFAQQIDGENFEFLKKELLAEDWEVEEVETE